MHDQAITVDEILRPTKPFDAAQYQILRRSQTLVLDSCLSICFESRATSVGFLQSLVALEGLSCPISLASEIEVAEALWRGPQGFVAMQITLVPQAHKPLGVLTEAVGASVQSLCLWAGTHAYPITLDGPLAPHMHAHVRLPQDALVALGKVGAQLDIGWHKPASIRAAVPRAIWADWFKPGGS